MIYEHTRGLVETLRARATNMKRHPDGSETTVAVVMRECADMLEGAVALDESRGDRHYRLATEPLVRRLEEQANSLEAQRAIMLDLALWIVKRYPEARTVLVRRGDTVRTTDVAGLLGTEHPSGCGNCLGLKKVIVNGAEESCWVCRSAPPGPE